MEDGHIISTVYPTNIDLEILSLRRSSHQREFLRVCLSIIDIIFGGSFVYVQGMYICIYEKKKKKTKQNWKKKEE